MPQNVTSMSPSFVSHLIVTDLMWFTSMAILYLLLYGHDSVSSDVNVLLADITADKVSAGIQSPDCCCSASHKRVKHDITIICACQNQLFKKSNRFLCRMKFVAAAWISENGILTVSIIYCSSKFSEHTALDAAQPDLCTVHWRWICFLPDDESRAESLIYHRLPNFGHLLGTTEYIDAAGCDAT